jgi:hypothetical protein
LEESLKEFLLKESFKSISGLGKSRAVIYRRLRRKGQWGVGDIDEQGRVV